MKIKIVAVGKIKERALADILAGYAKMIGKFCALELVEVEDENIPARESEAGVVRHLLAEATRALARIRGDEYVIALDMRGEAPDSLAFSKKLCDLAGRRPVVTFVIGGSCGLHPTLIERADYTLSMSNMTFPHQLARLVLLEQIFRAFKIIHNETYHK